MAKTTKAHFEYFQKCVQTWMNKLHVAGWQVYFDHADLGSNFANVAINYDGRVVTFTFCTEWRPTDIRPLRYAEINMTALHEVVHVLIAPLRCLAVLRFASEGEIDVTVEDLTVRLVDILSDVYIKP